MPEKKFWVTSLSKPYLRLDAYLAQRIKILSRAQIQSLIDRGKVTVNGEVKKSSWKLKKGDKVWIQYQIPPAQRLIPQDLPLHLLYDDGHIAVVDKPPGIIVHPGAGNQKNTLVNALLFRFPQIKGIGSENRPGIVHRLDKETSGVLVVAKNLKSYNELKDQFKSREVTKTYLTLVWGRMHQKEGEISHPIGRHVKDRKRMSVQTKKPRVAITFYSVLEEIGEFSLLKAKPLTGRTHQIRVHLSTSGHPVVGDKRYGRKKTKVKPPRLFLHAQELTLRHPETRKKMTFVSPIPSDLKGFLDQLHSKVD